MTASEEIAAAFEPAFAVLAAAQVAARVDVYLAALVIEDEWQAQLDALENIE